jgi:hypothetical protein
MAARTQTIDFMISRMEKICDIENDSHLSSAEKFEIMNAAIAEAWDKIIDSGIGDKYVKSATFNTVSGQQEYPIFTIASDFYRISQLYVDEGNGQWRPIHQIQSAEIQSFRPPNSVVPMKLYYFPYSQILTTGQTFDGINGWEDLAIYIAAQAVKIKRDEDYSQIVRRKMEIEKRLASMGQINLAEPKRVVRKRRRLFDPFFIYTKNINAYLVRGDNLELFYHYGFIP